MCREPLGPVDVSPTCGSLKCGRGHVFDLARQGYVNLLRGQAPSADTAEMIAARAAFFDAGHFRPLSEHLARLATTLVSRRDDGDDDRCVLEIGAGTGHHLAAVIEATNALGIALDSSKYAARRAAKAHPRIGSLVADATARLPIRDASVDLLLCVFAPRKGEEFHRVLAEHGALVVVTPEPGHMKELVEPLGLLKVDPRKDARLRASLGDWFVETSNEPLEWKLRLSRDEAATAVRMGPSAHHVTEEQLRERLEALPEVVKVTAAVRVRVSRPLSITRRLE